MIELVELRQGNSKTHDLGGSQRQLHVSMGPIHYKDDYASGEKWKDIDLTWEDNRITRAPYELTLEGKKCTIRNKKTGEVSTVELLDIGGKSLPDKAWEKSKGLARAPGIVGFDDVALDTDLEVVAENGAVRFTRVLKSDKAPSEAKFKVTGNFRVRASDGDGELPVVSTLNDGVLTESLGLANRPIKYPVRIDPTWQVTASTDDCVTGYVNATFSVIDTIFWAGYRDATRQDQSSAARFLNITIPAGVTIDSAYFVLTASSARTEATVNTRLRAEANVNPATFSDAIDFDARTWTTAPALVNWDAIPAWSVDESGADTTSPDIATLVQTVIDLPGWVSGKNIVILWDDFEERSTQADVTVRWAYSYNASTTKCPQLVITYTVPARKRWWLKGQLLMMG